MAVKYEWDVELSDEFGDIVEHWHCGSFAEAKHVFTLAELTPGTLTPEIVLVRDSTEDDREWAYMVDGTLPEFFADAFQRNGTKVPQRFHAEVARETA